MDCEANKYNFLEQMLFDANEEPTDLPLSLLKAITNNFSEDRKIGSGGFADVYEVPVLSLTGLITFDIKAHVITFMLTKVTTLVTAGKTS